jgi:pyridoxal phosphate-dependent aminotransferase EpsN
VARRRAVFTRYAEAFADIPGIEPQPEVDWEAATREHDQDEAAGANPSSALGSPPAPSRHNRWLSCFLIDANAFGMSAPELVRFLAAANVEARSVWRPMHVQPLFRGRPCVGGSVAEALSQRGLALPSSSGLSEEEQGFVISQVRAAHWQGMNRGEVKSK